jgi:hypothetical protein
MMIFAGGQTSEISSREAIGCMISNHIKNKFATEEKAWEYGHGYNLIKGYGRLYRIMKKVLSVYMMKMEL